MKKFILLSMAIAMVFSSCKKDKEDTNSSLFVKVFNSNSYSVEGATVFTVPATETLLTDTYGSVTFASIPTGVYDVYAIYENYGSGKKSIQVEVNSGTEAEIIIEYGNFPDFIPLIFVVSPVQQGTHFVFSPTDTVSFKVNVVNGIPGKEIHWESDLDGSIGNSLILDDLSSSIKFTALTVGEHVFTLSTEGSEGVDGQISFAVKTDGPASLYLYPIEVASFQLKLTWSYYEGEDFDQYRIYKKEYRENGTTYESSIKYLEGEWDTTALVPIQNDYNCEYYVRVLTSDYNEYGVSNTRSFSKGYLGHSFDYYANNMILHQYKNYAYFLYSDKILLYDYDSRTVLATRSVASIGYFTDITYNNNKATVYLVSDFRVYILDGETLDLVKTINFPNTVKSVSAVSNDLIFASVYQSYSGNTIYSYSLSQGKLIDSIGSDESESYMLNRVPMSNKLLLASDGYYSKIKFLDYTSDGQITGYGSSVSPSGYNFNDYPFAFSPDGSYFVPLNASSNIYQCSNGLVNVGTLSNSYQFRDITFSPNGDTIYGLTANNKRFITYTYPALEVIDEVETQSWYLFTQKKGGNFYSLVQADNNYSSVYYFVQNKPY